MQAPPRSRFRRARDALLRLRAFQALRHREYRLLLHGQTTGSMGTWMDEVTRGWLIYELTDSAVQLGLVRGIQAIPFLVLSPIVGSLADRWSRRSLLVLSQAAHALVFAVTALLVFTGEIRVWHVYVTAVLISFVQVAQQPARSAMVSDAVPREILTNALGLFSMVFNVSRTVGPTLAGAIIVLAGTGAAFAVQALFLFIATLLAVAMQPDRRRAQAGQARDSGSFTQSIVEGWAFSWRNESVRAALLVTMLVSLLIFPFTTLLPVFARDLLAIGADGQGMLLGAMGVGALTAAIVITTAGDRLPRGAVMLCAAMTYGLVAAVFGMSPWFALSLAAMLVAGLCQPMTNALVQTVVLAYSPAELRGRVSALFSMHHVLITVGAVVFGALVPLLGPRWTVTVMGLVGTLSIGGILLWLPRARHIR